MDQQHARPSFWKTPFGIFATLVVVVASVYLWIAHRDHLLARCRLPSWPLAR